MNYDLRHLCEFFTIYTHDSYYTINENQIFVTHIAGRNALGLPRVDEVTPANLPKI